ncbi:hypothetical protein [Hymenobacter crusticola]|uniref:Uncharacterized protein n=1 Tax=Hymenobacter crusticola TaxID=1770526 RepID=A0A243WD63_9BACT|nr:hypothetical protein [Hymenobacter crusticola]OUJ73023.1 hypothetical protein BXP70_14355 [Hymenobacter crusticola]
MQDKSWLSEYKWLLLLPASLILYLAFDPILNRLDKQMLGAHPEVILKAINSAKASPKIVGRTGTILSESHRLDKRSSEPDSLILQINLKGEKSTATITAYAVKQAAGAWRIYKGDTIFTK